MNIHPTAVVDPKAHIDSTVIIAPYVIIDGPVQIGPETKIGAHTVISGHTTIGARNAIHSFCSIGAPPQDIHQVTGKWRGQKIGDHLGKANRTQSKWIAGDLINLPANRHGHHLVGQHRKDAVDHQLQELSVLQRIE